MKISGSDPILRPADVDVSDLTSAKRAGDPEWVDGELIIPFDREPTEDEQKAIRRRLLTVDADHEARMSALADAAEDLTTAAKRDYLLRLLAAEVLGPLAADLNL